MCEPKAKRRFEYEEHCASLCRSPANRHGSASRTGPRHLGNWQGTYEAGKGLRTVLKISKADTGGWKAVLYTVDQGSNPFPVTSLNLGQAQPRLHHQVD